MRVRNETCAQWLSVRQHAGAGGAGIVPSAGSRTRKVCAVGRLETCLICLAEELVSRRRQKTRAVSQCAATSLLMHPSAVAFGASDGRRVRTGMLYTDGMKHAARCSWPGWLPVTGMLQTFADDATGWVRYALELQQHGRRTRNLL